MQFSIHYDEPVLRKAVGVFFKRRLLHGMGWTGMMAFAVCVIMLTYLLTQGDRSWFVGVIGAVLIIFIAVFFTLWRMHMSQMRAKLSAIPSRRAEVTLAPDAITIDSEAGAATLPWQGFYEVWKLPEFWLLFLAPNNFVTLPTRNVPREAFDYIEEQLPVSCKRI